MAEVRLDDDRLDAVLASVGAHLVTDVGAVAATTGAPTTRTATTWRRPLLVAALVLAVLAGAIVAIAPARRAVGGWFGIGKIEVEVDRTADPTGLPTFTEPATPVAVSAVDDLLGAPLPAIDGSDLGAPSGWWTLPEGGVLAGWADGATSLWIVLSDDGEALLKKVVADAGEVMELPALGDGGVALSGPHLLQTPHRRVGADNAVIWIDGELTLRLEGTADLDELIALAGQLAR